MNTINLNNEKNVVGKSRTTGKAMNIVLWIVQILTAGLFFMAASGKFTGGPEMVKSFELIGLGQWFRYLTGIIEVVAAILLLTPRYSGLGALLLIPTMIGAILAHLVILGGSPAGGIIFLAASLFIAWGRSEQIIDFINKYITKK